MNFVHVCMYVHVFVCVYVMHMYVCVYHTSVCVNTEWTVTVTVLGVYVALWFLPDLQSGNDVGFHMCLKIRLCNVPPIQLSWVTEQR